MTKAIPSTAALPRALPWTNAPTMDLSFIKMLVNSQTPRNIRVVEIIQKKEKAGVKILADVCGGYIVKRSTGSATLNTYLSAALLKPFVKIPSFIKNHPRTIRMKIGMVAFKLKINCP